MLLLCRLVAALPLSAVHKLGALLARIAFVFAGGERRRLERNLALAGYSDPALQRTVIEESGKTLLELPWIWLRPQEEVAKLVREVANPEVFLQAKERGKGIVFLTPHLGCFEVSAQFAAAHSPITVMYRPPRQRMLEEVWGASAENDSNVLNVYVNYLRNKIERGRYARLIHTVRGVGFLLSTRAPTD